MAINHDQSEKCQNIGNESEEKSLHSLSVVNFILATLMILNEQILNKPGRNVGTRTCETGEMGLVGCNFKFH